MLPEDHPDVEGLRRAGWTVVARSWAGQLDAARADRGRLRALVQRVDGVVTIRAVSEADLAAVLALDAATVDDYPGSVATQHTPLDHETVRVDGGRRGFGAWSPDGALVAVTYVDGVGADVETHFTVVAPGWRGRGVGSAVKAASVLALLDDGVELFRTGGSSDNAGIIAANTALGYVRDEEWVTLERPAP